MAERERVLGGRYRLLRPLGTGGMGSVWSAEDLVLGRTVALKELAHHLNGGQDLEARRARALREARALAQAVDPAIVQIYDVLVERGDPWLVMQYIPGPSLADLVASGPPDERTVARIGLRVLRALRAAHAANVLHRDVKPANILLDDTGRAYLVDFGIARITGATALTADNTVLGTLEFMAPERIRGDEIGPPSDLWSLGVTLYFALEGRSPFRASNDTAAATIWAIMNSPAPHPSTPGPLADAVTHLLEKDPTHRMRAEHLERALKETLTPTRPPTPTPPARDRPPPNPPPRPQHPAPDPPSDPRPDNRDSPTPFAPGRPGRHDDRRRTLDPGDEARSDDPTARIPPEDARSRARRPQSPAPDPSAEPRADDRDAPTPFGASRPEQRRARRPAPGEGGGPRDRSAVDPFADERPEQRRDAGPGPGAERGPRRPDRAAPEQFGAVRPEQRGARRPAPGEGGGPRDRSAGDPFADERPERRGDGRREPGQGGEARPDDPTARIPPEDARSRARRDRRSAPDPGGEPRADDFTAADPYADARSEGRDDQGRPRGEGRGASGPLADGRPEQRRDGWRRRGVGRGDDLTGRVPHGEPRGGVPAPAARAAPGLARQVRELPPERAVELLAGYAPAAIRDVLTELGRAAGPILLAMPREAAAQTVASARARTAAALLDAMAVAPNRAAPIVQILSTTVAARAFGYMTTPAATALTAALPSRDAARILAATDLRAAAGVLTALPPETAALLVDALPVRRACDILGYVPPATVATLLRAASHPDRLLSELSGPVRTQVLRHL
ncbi:protein kinase domain-containing protein [Actinomadura rayongensis]|uniref:non-specific serine/threonine protein kinase n=1 Tax=Actinomadura rayongensis TaxID=1429076 RepID=A0A6I4W4Q9_9ACTN|nr:protein kinase [Actinomadura rayongensis]